MSRMTGRSFVSGELDPALHQRVDLAKYQTGLATCKNFFLRAQGGLYNRAGLRFIGEVLDSSRRARAIPFQFNTEQAYILEFGHLTMRVIKDGGYVLDGEGPDIYQIATPYTEDDLFDSVENVFMMQFTQTADIMTITHRSHPVAELSRLDHDDWTLATVSFASTLTPPQFDYLNQRSISNITIDKSTVEPEYTGTGQVTIHFDVAHGYTTGTTVFIFDVLGTTELNGNSYVINNVTTNTFTLVGVDGQTYGDYISGGMTGLGKVLAVGSGAGSYQKTYHYVVTATNADGVESLPSGEINITTASLSQTAGVRLGWNEVEGADFYTVYKDSADGTGIYGFIGETKELFYTDYNIAGDTSRTPPEENQPISTVNNYPAAVGLYQQRKIFGNTYTSPQSIFATQTGRYNSMRSSTPARDDDALTYTISSRQVNEIRHIIDLEDMMLLTSGAEFRVTEGQDFVLTPSTIGARAQSYNGASWVRPTIVNDTVLYVQRQGSRVRDLNYTVESGKYSGSDLSIMSEHLFRGRSVVEMAYAAEPYGIVWCVMSDGKLLGLTFQKEHQVWGWHQHETDGDFESVAVIAEGDHDVAYFVVKRTIGGVTKRYIEKLEERISTSAVDAFFLDSALTYSGAAATEITGLDHLEGETVCAVADGNVVEDLVVSGGAITLPRAASVVHAGLPYVAQMKTLPLDDPGTTLQGRKKNVAEVILHVLESRGGWVGPDEDRLTEIKPRFDSDNYDAIALKSFEQRISISSDWNDYAQVVVEQRTPMPLAITALTPEFDIGG